MEPQCFITAFSAARHLSLSWTNSIQSIPSHPTSWRSIFILSSHLCLGIPSGRFPSGFSTKTLYITLFSPIRATFPAHLILLDFITRKILGEQYRSLSSSFLVFEVLLWYYFEVLFEVLIIIYLRVLFLLSFFLGVSKKKSRKVDVRSPAGTILGISQLYVCRSVVGVVTLWPVWQGIKHKVEIWKLLGLVDSDGKQKA